MNLLPSVLMGLPIRLQSISVYPPTVGEVLSNPMIKEYAKVLTISQEDIWDDLEEQKLPIDSNCPTPFDTLMNQASKENDPLLAMLIKTAIETFTRTKIAIDPEYKIIVFLEEGWEEVTDLSEAPCIADNRTFFMFQNMVREAMGEEAILPPEMEENPRLAALKAKFRKNKRLLKTAKRTDGLSFTTSLMGLCYMRIGITPFNLKDLPYAAISPLISMGVSQERTHIDSIALAAHADPKKVKLKPWLKDLDS